MISITALIKSSWATPPVKSQSWLGKVGRQSCKNTVAWRSKLQLDLHWNASKNNPMMECFYFQSNSLICFKKKKRNVYLSLLCSFINCWNCFTTNTLRTKMFGMGGLFYEVKCLCSRGCDWEREGATPASFSIFDSCDMKSVWFKFGYDIFTCFKMASP